VKFNIICFFGVVLCSLFTVLITGCGLWNDKMVEPHNIIVPSFNLTTYEYEGTDSQNIAEVWVYSETDVLGVFPLPASIPVLQQNGEDVVHITLVNLTHFMKF
jgi:hypothetical protein